MLLKILFQIDIHRLNVIDFLSALGEELLFFGNATDHDPHDGMSRNNDPLLVPLSILPTQSSSSVPESEESTINSKASDSIQGRY